MSTNRLHLDFKLTTTDERNAFVHEYLAKEPFITHPPTEEELETIGNYLLWGKDPVTGLNAKQADGIDIETKHGTWDKNSNVESLEGLMESPTFNEVALLNAQLAPAKVKREVFSRQDTLARCPEHLRPTFLSLFRQIDELDLAINYYDLAHAKRKNPPRPQLLSKFTDEEQKKLQEKITHWN